MRRIKKFLTVGMTSDLVYLANFLNPEANLKNVPYFHNYSKEKVSYNCPTHLTYPT